MNNIKLLLFLIFSLCFTSAWGQKDSVSTADAVVVPFDSTDIKVREANTKTVERLREDPDLNYGTGPAAFSLWERFKIWLGKLLRGFIKSAVSTDWIVVASWIRCGAILIYVILRLLKIDALKVFYSGKGKSITYEAIEENIHEMDFDKLIAAALASKDYRLAIRLIFLHSLKILSDKHLIHWHPGKTNHDYLNELKSNDIKDGFRELNEYFEHAWYGNFKIAPDLYGKVQLIFNAWKSKT
jgi:hypothetical protein